MMSNEGFSIISEESQDVPPSSGDEESMNSDVFHSNILQSGIANSRNSSRTSFDQSISDVFREVTAANLHEYYWPLNSVTDRYFIQEQVAVFLDIKSFKRKYPDLSRRPIAEVEERNYLLKDEIVSETQLNMGLTALRAEDVYDLMMNDYPEKFEEFKEVVAEKNKQALAVKQMELHAVKSDSKRLEEWRKKAMRSAVEWNTELNRDRSRERKCYFDMQTMVIQEPYRKNKIPFPTNFGSYPTALIPRQFQEFHKTYTRDELQQFPVNGILCADAYFTTKRSRSPGPITVKPEELLEVELEETKRKKEPASASKLKRQRNSSARRTLSIDESFLGEETGESCAFCQEGLYQNDRYVQCSKCGSCGHQMCLDMAEEMYDVVKTYNWMCMECKPCSICTKLDEEDKMLFCDRCDRGYHTFCVGLNELPIGRWVCPKFCFGGQRSKAAPAKAVIASVAPDKDSEAAVASVVATSLSTKHVVSVDETVEAVAFAVLSGAAIVESSSSSLDVSATSNLESLGTSHLEEPRPPKRRNSTNLPDVACVGCGRSMGKIRRKHPLCKDCIAYLNQEPIVVDDNEPKGQ